MAMRTTRHHPANRSTDPPRNIKFIAKSVEIFRNLTTPHLTYNLSAPPLLLDTHVFSTGYKKKYKLM